MPWTLTRKPSRISPRLSPTDLTSIGSISEENLRLRRKRTRDRYIAVSLPLLTALLSSFTCVMAYVIAVKEGRMKPLPFVPYISEMGDHRPQSSFFTLGMSLSCFVTLFIGMIRYSQVKNVYQACPKTNKLAMAVCVTFVFGKLVVSAFQLSSVVAIHFLGAGLYFIGAAIYALLQVHISSRVPCRRWILTIRVVSTSGMFMTGFIFGMFMSPKLTQYNRGKYNIAQSAEWCFAVLKAVYMLTFMSDFWRLYPIFDLKFTNMSDTNLFIVNRDAHT